MTLIESSVAFPLFVSNVVTILLIVFLDEIVPSNKKPINIIRHVYNPRH
jgi:hypothetical protein